MNHGFLRNKYHVRNTIKFILYLEEKENTSVLRDDF